MGFWNKIFGKKPRDSKLSRSASPDSDVLTFLFKTEEDVSAAYDYTTPRYGGPMEVRKLCTPSPFDYCLSFFDCKPNTMDYNLVWAAINDLGEKNGLWYKEKYSLPAKELRTQSQTFSIRPPRDRITVQTKPLDEVRRNARRVYFNANLVDLQLAIVSNVASALPYKSGTVDKFVNEILNQLSKLDGKDVEIAVEVFSKAEKATYRLLAFDSKAALAAFVQSEIADAVRSNQDRINCAGHPPSGLGCIALCHDDGQRPRFTFVPIWVGGKFYSAERVREQKS